MSYNHVVIYYFSGTGNAKNAAVWFARVAEQHGASVHLINIDRFYKVDVPELAGKVLFGFCSPTHGFNLPPIMLKFIRKFPKVKNADAFILNTRGGLKLSKLFIPGLSGLAQFFPALMLLFKGFKIVGMQPLDLPSNWLILHPGLRKNVIDSIYSRCHKIVDRFALRLMEGKRKFKAFLSLPFDIAVIPIAVGYYFIGRFFLAKTLVATDACNNCEKCIIECPVKAIELKGNRPFWKYKCESCMRCVNACPQRAIETAHTFSGILLIISTMVISPLLIAGLKYFGVMDFFTRSFLTRSTWSVIDAVVFLLFVFVSYRILHYLMKFKIFNKLVAYSSLSKYRFWRRYKAPKSVISYRD